MDSGDGLDRSGCGFGGEEREGGLVGFGGREKGLGLLKGFGGDRRAACHGHYFFNFFFYSASTPSFLSL